MSGSPSRNRAKGYRAERQLVAYLRKKGWAAWRIPTSASSSEALPDVLAVKGDEIAAFEVKYRSKNGEFATARVGKDQIKKLSDFLAPFSLYRRYAVIALMVRGKWVFKEAIPDGTTIKVGEKNGWDPRPTDSSKSFYPEMRLCGMNYIV